MSLFIPMQVAERVLPYLLFALYLITSVRLCRYSSWLKEGAPNPFLPRRLKARLQRREKRQMLKNYLPLAA